MRNHRQILSARRGQPNLRIVRNEESDDEATVLIYDIIDFFGVNAEDFTTQLSKLDVKTIHARINSPGGSVFDGVAIANALRAHPANIVVHIDGLAASIASVIAMAGNEIKMADNAFFMIHDPWTIALGNARELRKTADVLEKIGGGILKDYVRRLGDDTADQVKAWMEDETWFDAEEALEAGFIDSIEDLDAETEEESVAARSRYDLSAFKHAPAALATRDAKRKPTARELEKALRDAGCESAEARRIVALGLKETDPQTRDVNAEFVTDAERIISTLTS